MDSSRLAILDPSAGISGDMLLGALIAAGAPEAWLQALPQRLGLDGVTVEVRRVMRCGVACVKVDVRVHGELEHPNGEPAAGAMYVAGHPHDHAHSHGHPHAHPHADAHAATAHTHGPQDVMTGARGHGHSHAHTTPHAHSHAHESSPTHSHAADHAQLQGTGHVPPIAARTHEDHGTVDDDGRRRLHRAEGPSAVDVGRAHAHVEAHVEASHHAPHDHGAHRHVADLLAIVDRAPLSEWVKSRALAAIRLIGEAEGRVHGVPAEQVALHEVGAMDALVDIVGAIEGFEQLGVTRIATRPVTLGRGWVRCAHGTMPVPAPATAILVEGLAIGENGPVTGEATTPTGAALLRVLADAPLPTRWRAVRGDAWGAGGRDPAGWPNALRLLIAETAAEAADVTVVASDVDDLPAEYLEPLREALVAAGALDVQAWSTLGKKGRPAFRIEALAPGEHAASVREAFLRHSSTIGVRQWVATRETLARREVRVAVDGAAIRVKVVDAPGGPRAKAEYDDVAAAARQSGRSALEIARAAEALALAAPVVPS